MFKPKTVHERLESLEISMAKVQGELQIVMGISSAILIAVVIKMVV